MAGAVLAIVLSLAAVGYELTLPSVHDAPTRVAAIVRAHHAAIDALPLPTKLAAAVVAVEDEHFYSNVFVKCVRRGIARSARGEYATVATRAAALSLSNLPNSFTHIVRDSVPRSMRSDWA